MRIKLAILLCFLSIALSAQQEFAPIGAQWFQNEGIDDIGESHPLENYYVFTSEKDTLVDGLPHRKVGDYLFYQDGDQVYYR